MTDVQIVGGGVIGLSIARACALEGFSVELFEKEHQSDRHQSGRNSGVVHPGYNLKPGSLKAKICIPGAKMLKEFCREHGVPLHENGILVVDPTGDRGPSVTKVAENARKSGINGTLLEADEISSIEPLATGSSAFHCPSGASIDAHAYAEKLALDAERAGAVLHYGHLLKSLDQLDGTIKVNAAGLQSDRLAKDPETRIIPFRGQYHGFRPGRQPDLTGHVYAAPHPKFPFLGVHLSPSTRGEVWAGPSASLAFGRELYGRNWPPVPGVSAITWPGFWRLSRSKEFRQQVKMEWKKALSVRAVENEARQLVPSIRKHDIIRGPSAKIGHRAQLVTRDGKLVDDIVVKTHGSEIHIMNAVSPGLTGSLPFGQMVAKKIEAAFQRM